MNATTAALEIMGIGMVGIIAVMVIFYFSIKAIDIIFPNKGEKE